LSYENFEKALEVEGSFRGSKETSEVESAMVYLKVLSYYLLEELRNTRMDNLEPADPRSFTKYRNSQVLV